VIRYMNINYYHSHFLEFQPQNIPYDWRQRQVCTNPLSTKWKARECPYRTARSASTAHVPVEQNTNGIL
jgi:hypothetical protein